MKRIILSIASAVILMSCVEDEPTVSCNCEYVVYESEAHQTIMYETYRSTWSASCEPEILDQSSFTYSDGSKSYSTTKIECFND